MPGSWGSEGKGRRKTAFLLRRTWQGVFMSLHRCNPTRIDQLLRIAGEVHADIAQTLLAAAGVVNLLGVDADRLTEAACTVTVIAADRTRAANFFSHVYYLQTEIEATSVSIYSAVFRGVTAKSPSASELQRDFCQRGMGLLIYVFIRPSRRRPPYGCARRHRQSERRARRPVRSGRCRSCSRGRPCGRRARCRTNGKCSRMPR